MGHFITAENARELQAKSKATRQANKERKAKLALLPISDGMQFNAEELEIVEKQIARTCAVLDDETPHCPACERPALEPKDRAALLRALDVLLDRRRKLTGRFNPGTLKQPEKKLSPILVIDEPQPVQSAPLVAQNEAQATISSGAPSVETTQEPKPFGINGL